MVIAASAPPPPGERLSSHAMSNEVTRAFLEGTLPRSGVLLRRPIELSEPPPRTRPPPRHPARRTRESTAGLLARGSSPVAAFPGHPSGLAWARRLQLRGQLRHWKPMFRTAFPVRSRDREAADHPYLRVARCLLSM